MNALVVYTSTHLPCAEGLENAQQFVIPDNADLSLIMQEMNDKARRFQDWDAVIDSVEANCHA